MKLVHKRSKLATFGYAAVFACLLNISMASMAQDSDQEELVQATPQDSDQEELVQATPQDSETDPLAEAAEREELAPIVLRERDYAEDSTDDDPLDVDDIALEEFSEPEISSENYNEQLQRLFASYKEAVLDSMFDEADTLAKQIVELSIRVNGIDSRKSATALTNLAVAQHGMEDYASAILNYGAAIGIVERIDDRLSGDLVNPLRGLGAAQFASGRPDLAKDAFDRAVHISHVNDGPHNLDQIETLLSLAETYLAVGETKSAANIQKRIFYLQARNIAMDSVEIIPALQTRASWQHRMHMYDQERFTWRRIINIIEDDRGNQSLDLIEPLTALANSYLGAAIVGLPAKAQPVVASGEPYLKRAIRIAERNEDATWDIRVDATLELGDYYILTDRAGRAHSLYKDAWDILSEDESLLEIRSSVLESGLILRDIYPPTLIDGDKVAAPVKDKPSGFSDGRVVFSYSVNTRGRATNIKLVEANPSGLDAIYTTIGRELRYIVHRPKLVDGKPIQSEDLKFSHEFFFREKKDPEPDKKETELVGEIALAE